MSSSSSLYRSWSNLLLLAKFSTYSGIFSTNSRSIWSIWFFGISIFIKSWKFILFLSEAFSINSSSISFCEKAEENYFFKSLISKSKHIKERQCQFTSFLSLIISFKYLPQLDERVFRDYPSDFLLPLVLVIEIKWWLIFEPMFYLFKID